jgi:DNA topoisomerase VI subunit B
LLAVVEELTDNVLDEAEETGVAPVIQIVVEANSISVADQGRGIEPTVIGALVDYSIKTSSRAAIVSPSRGQQGNALQSITAMGHALAPGDDEAAVVIESQGEAHTIRLVVHPKVLCLPPSQILLCGRHPAPREKRRRWEARGPQNPL